MLHIFSIILGISTEHNNCPYELASWYPLEHVTLIIIPPAVRKYSLLTVYKSIISDIVFLNNIHNFSLERANISLSFWIVHDQYRKIDQINGASLVAFLSLLVMCPCKKNKEDYNRNIFVGLRCLVRLVAYVAQNCSYILYFRKGHPVEKKIEKSVSPT